MRCICDVGACRHGIGPQARQYHASAVALRPLPLHSISNVRERTIQRDLLGRLRYARY